MAQPGSLVHLREQCQIIEATVRAGGWGSEEELTAYRPGGGSNPEKGRWGWMRWYFHLGRFMGRQDKALGSLVEADMIVLDALRDEPRRMLLEDGKTYLSLYPKSFDALVNCHVRNHLIGQLDEFTMMLKRSRAADDIAWLEPAYGELSFQYQVLVWIASTEGPEMPFQWGEARAEWKDGRPDIPEQIRNLSPFEIIRAHRLFVEVNGRRLMAMERLIASEWIDEQGASHVRPSWSVFFSTVAAELHIDSVLLMRNRSLGSVMATWRTAKAAQLEAHRRAEADAKAHRGRTRRQPIGVELDE